MLWLWFMIFVVQVIKTRYKLVGYNYMTNRYLHLSFRYYSLQASLVTAWALIDFINLAVAVSQVSDKRLSLFENFAVIGLVSIGLGRVNSYKSVFFTLYAFILAFIYLPIGSAFDQQSLTSKLASTYVITEKERIDIIKKRKKLVKSLNAMQQSLLNNISNFNPYVCCIDKAINLCAVSFEVYYDQPGQPTAAGLGHDESELKDMDLESYGYEYIALNNDEEHDTFCCIARHKETRKILIAFRGTSSGKNWNDNAKYAQVPLLLHLEAPKEPLQSPFIVSHLFSKYMTSNLESGLPNINSNGNELHQNIENEKSNDEPIETGGDMNTTNEYDAVFDEDLENITEENKSVASNISNFFTGDRRPSLFNQAATTVLGTATILTDAALQVNNEVTTGVASQTPGLKKFVQPYVHQYVYNFIFCLFYLFSK